MTGLLQKDISILRSEFYYALILLLVTCFVRNDFLYAFCSVYMSALPIGALGYDERSKWHKLADMLPFTAEQLVGSKYLLGFLCTGGTTCLLTACQIGRASFDNLSVMLLTACTALILQSIELPLMFWIGAEKGRLLYLLLMICSSSVLFSLKSISPLLKLHSAYLLPAVALTAIAANLISIKISGALYRHTK